MSNLKGNRKIGSGDSPFNEMEFFVQNQIKNTVNTAIPVKVLAVYPNNGGKAGFVDVVPLLQSYDGFGNAIPSQTIFKIPYSRIQGGIAALIIDPAAGDIGLAVFAQQDSTNLSGEPQKPLSKRCFSMADGFYVGGFLNQKPEIYLELKQDKTANLICPEKLTVQAKTIDFNCDTMTINAGQAVNVNTPTMQVSGNLSTGTGGSGGTVQVNGSMSVTEDVTASGISLNSHTHTCPDGETGGPH